MASICVFCGSSSGARPTYAQAARELGDALGRNGHRLVYGGASVGLMGILADATLAAKGDVLGILPKELTWRERDHPRLGTITYVSSMAARKERMIAEADAFIALPGGIGTLDEIFEVLCGQLVKSHKKPLGLVDVEGYWRPLRELLNRGVDEAFTPATSRDAIVMAESAETVLSTIVRQISEPTS